MKDLTFDDMLKDAEKDVLESATHFALAVNSYDEEQIQHWKEKLMFYTGYWRAVYFCDERLTYKNVEIRAEEERNKK